MVLNFLKKKKEEQLSSHPFCPEKVTSIQLERFKEEMKRVLSNFTTFIKSKNETFPHHSFGAGRELVRKVKILVLNEDLVRTTL